MKILISAAEASSDIHGAELLKSLKKELEARGERLEAFGCGGPQLVASGLEQSVDARQLLSMGFLEILGRLPKILAALRTLALEAGRRRPDVAVVLDYPDFHFRLVKRLRSLGVPVVYYIPPKVWAWRTGRVRFLREWFSTVLCIFPFELEFFRDHGVAAAFVGNPLLDELPLDLKKPEARRDLGLTSQDIVLLVMPGSRPSEVSRHLELMLDAAVETAREIRRLGRLGDRRLQVVMPFPATAQMDEMTQRVESWKSTRPSIAFAEIQLHLFQGNAPQCMIAADAGLIKSGTSTLEAAVLGCPHAVVFKTGWVAEWIFKIFIRYPGPVGLVNLVAGSKKREDDLAKEILLDRVSVRSLSDEAVRLLMDANARKRFSGQVSRLRSSLRAEEGASPSVRAASEIIRLGRLGPVAERPPSVTYKAGVKLVSSLWSGVNGLVRKAVHWRVLRPRQLPVRVISVGNLQAGGAGKTPLVRQIAKEAIERGLRVGILSRGYGGVWERSGGVLAPDSEGIEAAICGDEPALLHETLPGAWIGVGADRAESFGRLLAIAEKLDCVILDDGFQHWRLKRDVEVLAVTSRESGEVVYRDSPSAVSHSQLVVWTKGEAKSQVILEAEKKNIPLVRVRFVVKPSPGQMERKILLICGVGDSKEVVHSARQAGFDVAEVKALPDHCHYREEEIRMWQQVARQNNWAVAATGKDWVKWKDLGIAAEEGIILEPEVEFVSGRDLWDRVLWGK